MGITLELKDMCVYVYV